MDSQKNVVKIEPEEFEQGKIIKIKSEDDNKEKKMKKKGLSNKNKIIFIGTIVGMFGIGYLLLGMLFNDENNQNKDIKSMLSGIKSKDLIAQGNKINKENSKNENEINSIRDKTFDSIDGESEKENDKSQGLIDYVNKGADGSASDNFIANEELNTVLEQDKSTEDLKDKLNTESIPAASRAIAQKEDYTLDKGTSFAYSKQYEKAEYFDNKSNNESIVDNKIEPTAPNQTPGESTGNEFEGMTEAQIKEKLMDQTIKSMVSKNPKEIKNQSQKPTTIIYNKLDLVRIYEGQILDGVLLNKLVSDTEESPVLISIAKDFYDQRGLYVIIPAGSRVIGTSQIVNYQGASRLFISFNRMILPNGISVNFPDSNKALDIQGTLGVSTSINSHFWKKMGSAIFVGLLDGLGGLAQTKAQDTQWANSIERSQNNMSQISNQIIQNNTNILPTITVREGHKIKIYISSDILISAYSPISKRSYLNE